MAEYESLSRSRRTGLTSANKNSTVATTPSVNGSRQPKPVGYKKAHARSTVYLNGKFTAQDMTGTQRVALCLVAEFDRLLGQSEHAPRVVLLCPPGGKPPPLSHIEVRHVGSRRVSLFAWEQLYLPLVVGRSPLLNLGGTAPLLGRHRVCIVHDAAVFDCPQAYTLPFRIWYRFLFRVLSRSARSIFTVSDFSGAQLAHHLKVRPERIEVLSNGSDHLQRIVADEDALQRFGLSPQRYWLAVGGASINKNMSLLRRAFERMNPSNGTKLVIVGGLNSHVFGDQPAAALSGDARVVVTGPVSDETLKTLYLSATALVFPSLYEGCGLPTLEAMRCACPVIASSAASIPEVCGDAALYFDPTSVDSLVAAMERLQADASLRTTLVDAGLARAPRFDWRSTAQRVYERLTS